MAGLSAEGRQGVVMSCKYLLVGRAKERSAGVLSGFWVTE